MITADVPHLARHLMTKHGLVGWRFEWDHAKRRAGCCRYRSKRITLSVHYVSLNVADKPDDVVDTILHEIAHALSPGDGHGEEWKAACVRIGARPERCYDNKRITMPKGKYSACCKGCSKVFHRHKQVKRDKGRFIYCAKCGPDTGRLEFRCGPPPTTTSTTPTPPPPPEPRSIWE